MYMPILTYHNYRQWMLQQQQRKDEVLAFELKEPCTPLGTVRTKKFRVLIVGYKHKAGSQMEKKATTTFLFVQTPIDNILHGESEVRM